MDILIHNVLSLRLINVSTTSIEGVVPGKPHDLMVSEATRNYVVLSWKPPNEKRHEGVMYYVEKVRNVLFTLDM